MILWLSPTYKWRAESNMVKPICPESQETDLNPEVLNSKAYCPGRSILLSPRPLRSCSHSSWASHWNSLSAMSCCGIKLVLHNKQPQNVVAWHLCRISSHSWAWLNSKLWVEFKYSTYVFFLEPKATQSILFPTVYYKSAQGLPKLCKPIYSLYSYHVHQLSIGQCKSYGQAKKYWMKKYILQTIVRDTAKSHGKRHVCVTD